MGKLALAAKVTHVPSMYLSEFPGPHLGCRDAAIEGHQIISRRALDLGVDTVVVFDVHWLVNSGYHINCGERFRGVYTSHELPHFIKEMEYEYRGNPALGKLIAQSANERGLKAIAHQIASLELEYGTLLPMRYMNSDDRFSLVSVAAWCAWHTLDESRAFGQAVRDAIERGSDTVMALASGSLWHRFHNNRDAEDGLFTISREFYRQVDLRVVDLWRSGNFKDFCAMLPEYANLCKGEGGMHDTAMLLGGTLTTVRSKSSRTISRALAPGRSTRSSRCERPTTRPIRCRILPPNPLTTRSSTRRSSSALAPATQSS